MEEKIKELFVICLEDESVDKDSITTDSNLMEIGMNSFVFIKLVVALETEYGIEFSDEELDYNKFATVRDIMDYIESKK